MAGTDILRDADCFWDNDRRIQAEDNCPLLALINPYLVHTLQYSYNSQCGRDWLEAGYEDHLLALHLMCWSSVCYDELCTAEEELDARVQEMYEGMTDSAFGGSRDSDDATSPSAS
eukprot:1081493-Rhodomonas_salina.1